MSYDPSNTITEVLRELGHVEPQSAESIAPESYDQERAHGYSATSAETAAAVQVADPRETPGPAPVIGRPARGNGGPSLVDTVGGYSWRQRLSELRTRPAWHSVATPAEVDSAWEQVTAAAADAEAAAAEVVAMKPRKVSPSAQRFGTQAEREVSPERAAGQGGEDMPPARKIRLGASIEAVAEYASGLFSRAGAARSSYDQMVQQAVAGDWGAALAQAVPPAHTAALAALAECSDALLHLRAAGDAAVKAGTVQGHDALPAAQGLDMHLRLLLDDLGTMAQKLTGLDADQPLTEVPLRGISRRDRVAIARGSSVADLDSLFLVERDEKYAFTHLSRGHVLSEQVRDRG